MIRLTSDREKKIKVILPILEIELQTLELLKKHRGTLIKAVGMFLEADINEENEIQYVMDNHKEALSLVEELNLNAAQTEKELKSNIKILEKKHSFKNEERKLTAYEVVFDFLDCVATAGTLFSELKKKVKEEVGEEEEE